MLINKDLIHHVRQEMKYFSNKMNYKIKFINFMKISE